MLYRLSCIPTPTPGRSHRIPQYIWSCRENSSVHMVTSVHVVVQTEYLSTCGRAGRIPLVVQKKKLRKTKRADTVPQCSRSCIQNTSIPLVVQAEYLSKYGRADRIPQYICSCSHNTSVHLVVQTQYLSISIVQTQYLSTSGRVQTLAHYIRSQ